MQHTAILLNTGEVMIVGYNSFGQLGDGTNTTRKTLVSINENGNYDKTNAIAISCGNSHTAILLDSGEVMTVGHNYYSQLGDYSNTNRNKLVSMKENGNYDKTNATAISCGAYHTAILLNTGEVMTAVIIMLVK